MYRLLYLCICTWCHMSSRVLLTSIRSHCVPLCSHTGSDVITLICHYCFFTPSCGLDCEEEITHKASNMWSHASLFSPHTERLTHIYTQCNQVMPLTSSQLLLNFHHTTDICCYDVLHIFLDCNEKCFSLFASHFTVCFLPFLLHHNASTDDFLVI